MSPEISRLRRLASISVGYGLWPAFDGHLVIAHPAPRAVVDLIDKNGPDLHEIRLSGDPLWTVQLPNLRSLTLTEVQQPKALSPVLKFGTLTVLRLYILHFAIDGFLDILSSAAATCPVLRDFKLICESTSPMPDDSMQIVANFVKTKKRLERLHVIFYAPSHVPDAPLMDVLKDLPALRVIGFEVARPQVRDEDVAAYDAAIPLTVTDMLLYTEVGDVQVDPQLLFGLHV